MLLSRNADAAGLGPGRFYFVGKRLIDLALCLMMMPLILPVIAICGVALWVVTWPDFKISDDPRVTRIGRILRKTSLDELPQTFNVIKGDMSLVGPRPTSFSADTYTLWHTERLEVQPGITGLWQVSGRSDVDFDERLRLDIEYIRQRSLWFDMKLLYRTVAAVLRPSGAY